MNKTLSTTVTLRPLSRKDASRLVEIGNNVNISNNLRDGFPHPFTLRAARTFIRKTIKAPVTTIFAIQWNGEHVGNIGLHPQDDIYRRTAELGYFIGEDYWGKGITTEAVRQIVDYGFEKLDLVRIYAGIYEYNIASMRVLEKNGFDMEGIARKAVVKNGKILDEYRFAAINPRYTEKSTD